LPEDTHLKGPFEQVVLLFIDAFGWAFFERYANTFPFLKRGLSDGICSKLTSLFPSTTAAHVTCIHTGLAPNQSGIYEWFIHEPHLGEIITPLLFNYAGERSLSTLPLDPFLLFPGKTLFHTLAEEGVASHSFQPKAFAHSTSSKALLSGSTIHGYEDSERGLQQLLESLSPQTYACFYYGDLDATGHRKGIDSKEFTKEAENIFAIIETFANNLPPKTALLVTADHGMVNVSRRRRFISINSFQIFSSISS
jgi:predicted AlkP superfamily pyrophosphatase or phosphodiesterase